MELWNSFKFIPLLLSLGLDDLGEVFVGSRGDDAYRAILDQHALLTAAIRNGESAVLDYLLAL